MRLDRYEPKIPHDYDDLYIYVPEVDEIIRISEGSGDNLTDQDIEEGYVDYIYYSQYAMRDDFNDIDGGMVMLTEHFRSKYSCTVDCVEDVLDLAYENRDMNYVVLG